jgi:putative oxidoreductase
MRNVALLGARLVLGGYLAVHGAQKLFGSFGGAGLDAAGAGFEKMGLSPGTRYAALAGVAEVGGGVLTAAGVGFPLGPVAIAGSMVVATATQFDKGPLLKGGGYELPLTNLALAAVLAATGPGALRAGPQLSKRLTRVVVLGATVMTAAALAQVLAGLKAKQRLDANASSGLGSEAADDDRDDEVEEPLVDRTAAE